MGYKYYNSTDMDFYLTVGYTVHFSRAQGVNQGVLVPGVHIGSDDYARNRRLSSRQLWGAPVVGSRLSRALAQGLYASFTGAPLGYGGAWALRTLRSPPPPRSRFG